MSQTQPVDITNGTLVLDEATLRSAQIKHKARIIIRDRSILILPESDQGADPVNSTFGLIQLPTAIAKEIADSKELEYEFKAGNF